MNTDPMALEQAARAMLRAVGAGGAKLLLAQATAVTSQTGLGLSTPAAVEVELEPVLVQAITNGKSLLAITTRGAISKALNGADGSQAVQLLTSSMLRAGNTLYRITAVTVKHFGGAELMYELGIEE
jgi:hypothetical protein